MQTVTIHEAKTHLSRLIAQVLEGEDVTISNGRSGEDLVRLVPAKPLAKVRRQLGWLADEMPKGSKGITESGFWDPLTDEEMGLGDDPADPLNWRR